MSCSEMVTPLVDRLRGHYNVGPALPNGEPEFGQRTFPRVPIQLEAADEIERLRARADRAEAERDALKATVRDREAEILRIQTHETAAAHALDATLTPEERAKFKALADENAALKARAERAEAAWARCATECRAERQHEDVRKRRLQDWLDLVSEQVVSARAAVDAAGDLEATP